ncbi:putative mitochondrial folate carrier protein Flx1 [Aspergillus heteromorphus CBS 117.55]|uniref:Putative mitochondrial folate carrier protein Flx1 n=1 Tax=Aspergillus heteromorphus CBS 117.55 TaxID=1448321 RepID=A0A317WTB9_9EURO|nr:putative mitochondrial folate carrier protein Flx1 [Aspergillus heteromorphus CBS 117.55]PWY88178.1 putative mitochondrial folate carrier protein Flx1 [Aspergillus heteromorphus CBS 117.55]
MGTHSTRIETIAGTAAGIVTPICLHPLDLVKTRLQVRSNAPPTWGDSTRLIRDILHEGGGRALYRGLSPNLIGNVTGLGLYFLLYSSFNQMLLATSRIKRDGKGRLNMYEYFLTSGAAGAITTILTNPIWVIKTRMLTTSAHASSISVPNDRYAYPSFFIGMKTIYRTEGLGGFYRGLVPGMFGVFHGAFQFMAYEKMKFWLGARKASSGSLLHAPSSAGISGGSAQPASLNMLDIAISSGLSRIFANVLTYPHQVLRSRMQAATNQTDIPRRLVPIIRSMWRENGIAAFYRGLGPGLFRILPGTWLTFMTYEKVKTFLGDQRMV